MVGESGGNTAWQRSVSRSQKTVRYFDHADVAARE